MREKKYTPGGKQLRMQNLLDAWQVDLCILRERMVSLHQERACCQQQQNEKSI